MGHNGPVRTEDSSIGSRNRPSARPLNPATSAPIRLVESDRNHITRIDVVFKTDPFSEASLEALDRVHAVLRAASVPGQPLEGAAAIGIAGSTSMVHDLKQVTTNDERRMYFLVTLGVYAILVALLRRPGICLYLIATVVLGYLASLGVTDLLFRACTADPRPGLDWTGPSPSSCS